MVEFLNLLTDGNSLKYRSIKNRNKKGYMYNNEVYHAIKTKPLLFPISLGS